MTTATADRPKTAKTEQRAATRADDADVKLSGPCIEDLLIATEWYSTVNVARWLGISEASVQRAIDPAKTGGHVVRGDMVEGGVILKGLKVAGVSGELSDAGRKHYEIAQRCARARAAQVAPPIEDVSVIGKATEVMVEQESQTATFQRDAERMAFAHLNSALMRDLAGKSHKDDPRVIAGVAQDWGLTTEDITAARVVVKRGMRFAMLIGEREAAAQAQREARTALHDLEKRHREAMDAAQSTLWKAEGKFSECADAVSQLDNLRRQSPRQFDDSGQLLPAPK